jgi:hypothetical protein
MKMTTENNDWLDFKAIKATIEVKPILQHFDILPHLSENGAELVGWCPLGNEHGKQDSFAFNNPVAIYPNYYSPNLISDHT